MHHREGDLSYGVRWPGGGLSESHIHQTSRCKKAPPGRRTPRLVKAWVVLDDYLGS